MLEDDAGQLRFLVHPEWQNVVGSDSIYIEPLLQEFPERAKERPGELLKQLSSLGVGPLVTHETGQNLASHSFMGKIFSMFVPLEPVSFSQEAIFE